MSEILDIRKRILGKKNLRKNMVKNDEYDKPIEITDGRGHGYFTVDDLFVDEFMRMAGGNVVMVYLSLCRHTNKERLCWPSIRRMSMQSKMSPNSVTKSIKWLEDHRMLKIDREKGGTNIYRLLEKKKWVKMWAHRVEPSRITSQSSLKSFRELNSQEGVI
jgi:DNA-binding transcriptional ArsR family regulator